MTSRDTGNVVVKRNAHIIAVADRILIVYAEKSGKTEALYKESLDDMT